MAYLPVGRILSTHGLKGEIKFRYYNEAHEDFLKYASLFVKDGTGFTEFQLAGKRFQKGLFYIKLKGLESVEEVSPLRNRELFVREEDLAPPEDGEYYEYQLIGLDVMNRRNEKLGTVKAVVHTKAHDILEVTTEGEEMFIPLMEDFVCNIDLESSSIVIDEDALSA